MAAAAKPDPANARDLARYATAMLNVLEDFGAERAHFAATQKAILNILDDFGAEKDRLEGTQKAILNILQDFGGEKARLENAQKAVLNILDDFGAEKDRLEGAQKAMLNILDDFAAEKARLVDAEKAMINLLDDFDAEKRKAQAANEELTRKGEELARSNAELEQFAYVASHDLQEPLRMVSSYMQLFEKKYRGQIDEQADKYIRYAVDGARRMQALINGLLEYSRAARREVEPRFVDANAALADALLGLRQAIDDAAADVRTRSLPPVLCTRDQLAQIFQNLVGNAVKFHRPGVAPNVEISAERAGSEVVFTVQDDGIGVDPQYAARIFVIFQRLHTRTEYPGTGIGLSVCKKLVERHGGRIWVEPAPRRGACFRFTLPAAAGRGQVAIDEGVAVPP